MGDDTSVKVAVRIRPQISREILEMCHICTSVTPGEPQVVLGKDKGFTFDHVFDTNSHQDSVYETCIGPLIEGCLEGYNATVLAYGQTGSGKTYTMGTGFDINMTADERGVIPRAVEHLYKGIAERQNRAVERGEPPPEFKINAQFMELYNEEINDLLNTGGDLDDKGNKMHIKIHEDSRGGIYTVGVTTRNVSNIEETLQCLKMGALSRTTGSTQMNTQSSRSHAIFTLHVKQQRIVKIESGKKAESDMEEDCYQEPLPEQEPGLNEFETLTAKFHFVDLAGSERLKRTGATGERAREGISINCGLLALGNVISALGDKSRRVSHVPYRDSKLTRLLQDSLGGNSRTLMIACVSPSDRDFMETLNTLKYANRAKNIKNRVMLNQDKSSQTISLLRREIQRLELELMEYKQGKRLVGEDGSEQINDMFHENTMLQTENNNLRSRIKALQETVERLTVRNSELLAEKQAGAWITSEDGSKSDITEMIQGYIKEVEDIRAKLMESEEMCVILRRNAQRSQSRLTLSPSSGAVAFSGQYDIIESEHPTVYDVLQDAKKDVKKLKKKTKKVQKEAGIAGEMVTSTMTDLGGSDGEDDKPDESEMGDADEDDDDKDVNGVDDGDESSDSEGEEEKEHIHEDLADLTCEITIKEKLIMELEQSQRRLITMRHHYEEKLTQLQMRIKETEIERDRVLSSLTTSKENQGEEKVKKVKEQFEKKLSTLQNELKKMQAAKKEHAQLMRTQSKYETQMKQLKDEVLEMKKTKVRLMNQMKEASSKHKMEEKRRLKEIEQVKKDSRKKDIQLRKLETEKRLKENILRRKQEEVNALKRMTKPMSDKVAGRVSHPNVTSSSFNAKMRRHSFSPKQAKHKWQNLEKNITKLVLSKQSVYNVERDMDRWLHEREKLSRILEKIIKKREKAIQDGKDSDTIRDLEEQIDNLRANIDYVRENIYECQSSIAEIEDTKDDMSALDVNTLINNMKFEEASYMIEKLLNMAISQSFNAAQKDTCVKELEAKLQQVVESNSVQQQLLQHLLNQNNEDAYNVFLPSADQDGFESASSSRSVSPVDSALTESQPPSTTTTTQYARRNKARRKTATPEDLLYPRESGLEGAASRVESLQNIPESSAAHISAIPSCMTASCPKETLDRILMPPPTPMNISFIQDSMHRVTSAPGSLREMVGKPKLEPSPLLGRKTYGGYPDVSPSLRRKNFGNANNYPPSPPSRQNSVDTTASDYSPPGSPTGSRRNFQRDDNVFSRLTSGIKKTNKPDRGVIASYQGRNPPKTSPLVCTHIAEGHSKAVLAVTATDDVLFSSSKDRTVKIWDLHTGQEIQSLGGHPSNVVTVKYCEYTRLAFSVSASYVKVWDVRENPARCVKTLTSSGSTTNGPIVLQTPSRTSQMSMGESQINDIALNHYGTTLYSASGNIVRIWDLKMFSCVGRLSGGHQAAVMCLAVDDIGMDNNIVVTGSKDHYIKVFGVVDGVGGIQTPKINLEPPHYDGIQSLAICGDYLFSGSRDMCIKKWDLSNNTLVQSLNQAHKDWICALSFLPSGDVLLSGCRGGCLKLWSTDTCQLMGEIRAHIAPINAITTNSSAIFTASNDNNISVWRLRVSNETSPDFSDFGDERFH